jgi:predicted nucleic acid-binding Zn ribbon protein
VTPEGVGQYLYECPECGNNVGYAVMPEGVGQYLYECPECGNKVKLAQPAVPGKKLRCPVCEATFAPQAVTIALAEQPKPRPVAAQPAAARPAVVKPVAAQPPARPQIVEDDLDNDVTPYGVVQETEEEKRLAAKNKPTFTETHDKFKKSARGPASALLVLPTNLLVAEGALTCIVGVAAVVIGLWPLVFTDAPPSDEEIAEQIVIIFGGIVAFTYGALICYGASKMHSLESYAWGMIGAVLGILPLLAGIFAIVALRDPRVIAGFEEMEGAIEDEEGESEDEDEDDEDEDEDE